MSFAANHSKDGKQSQTRSWLGIVLAGTMLVLATHTGFAKPLPSPFNYDHLKLVVIHEDARNKPLDTYARETMKLITSREYWKESKAPHLYLARDPMTNFLSMLYEPEKWKEMKAIHLGKADVKELLGMQGTDEWIAYNDLSANQAFKEAFREIVRKQQADEKLTGLEQRLGELHSVLNTMDGIFYGTALKLVPVAAAEGSLNWMSLDEIAAKDSEEQVRESLHGMLTGFTQGKAADFNQASKEFASVLREKGGAAYPVLSLLEKEAHYNTFKPFRKAWVFLLLSAILFGVAMGLTNSIPYLAGWAALLTGFSLAGYGLALRVMIAGRPPVSNMYESVIYMGWGVLLFAGIFELVYRQRIFGLCGAAMGVIVLVLADLLPFDPAISPLVPVLRSNYWLIIHVMTIVISYSAFGLAMAIAHFSLGYYLFAPQKKNLIRTANAFVYRAIQVGLLLLTAGTILGGVWANESWGRFWGWDPKETWAFISILFYLVLLHSRLFGLVGPFGLAIGAVLGFQFILMTWYGVNFVLGTGLHSYGFGTGGQGYIAAYLGVELLFMAIVATRYKLIGPGGVEAIKQDKEAARKEATPGDAQPSTT